MSYPMVRRLKSVPLKATVEKFLDEIRPNVTADTAFQASMFTRWSDTEKSNYVASVATGMAPSKFIFADVEKCLEHAIENEQEKDIEYFQYWLDKGVLFLNIDSNNRTINLEAFSKGEFCMANGFYNIDDWIGTISEENSTYDTLPSAVKKAFLESEITIELYVDAGREELSRLFININDGKPLNQPEKRNAMTSNIAKTVRDLASDYATFFYNDQQKWFTENDAVRRGIDDFIAANMYFYFNGFDVSANHPNLWKAYSVNSSEDKSHTKFKIAYTKFLKLLQKFGNLNALTHRNSLFDLWMIYIEEIKNSKSISDDKMKLFVDDFIDAVASIIKEGKIYKHSSWRGEGKSFETIIGGRQPTNNKMRYELIVNCLDLNKYFKTMDKQRTVSDHQKLAAAYIANWKTPEGKDIDRSKLNDGKTYHKGHVIPHNAGIEAGGVTTLENTVVQEAHDNLKLGAKRLGEQI